MNEKNEKKRHRIHTTISKKSYEILQKYVAPKPIKGEIRFSTQSKVLEKALDLLDKYYNPEKDDFKNIWNRAKVELNTVLVGKPTFLSYISGDYKRAYKENIAVDIIEWYTRKHIDELSLEELLEAIKSIWIAANYFFRISIEKESEGTYLMTLYHDFHSLEYGNFWGNYFLELLHSQKNCVVKIFPRMESLVLNIIPPKNKK